MQLLGARRDLKIAASEIEKMKRTKNFDEFQESWENFLMRIERAWELTERTLTEKKGFQQWHKPYAELRKKDSLLKFLKHARNSEMHSISSAVSKPLKMLVKDKTGRGLLVNSISSRLANGALTVHINTPDMFSDVSVEIVPSDPELARVKSRGKWYNPPGSHLKEKISNLHPVSVAQLGLTFYKSYVEEAEFWLNNI